MTARSGFTLIEVVASLLVLTIGILAVVGMLMYGLVASARAQAQVTGMATAMSLLDDPKPTGVLDYAVSGSSAFSAGSVRRMQGYANGYFFIRTEAIDNLVAVDLASTLVSVEIYETINGEPITSVSRRVLQRKP